MSSFKGIYSGLLCTCIVGDIAYIGEENGLVIVNVSDPTKKFLLF
ncbi:MAG: hypothetical protein ACFFAS_07820 [Promethearchaeota archaeon]